MRQVPWGHTKTFGVGSRCRTPALRQHLVQRRTACAIAACRVGRRCLLRDGRKRAGRHGERRQAHLLERGDGQERHAVHRLRNRVRPHRTACRKLRCADEGDRQETTRHEQRCRNSARPLPALECDYNASGITAGDGEWLHGTSFLLPSAASPVTARTVPLASLFARVSPSRQENIHGLPVSNEPQGGRRGPGSPIAAQSRGPRDPSRLSEVDGDIRTEQARAPAGVSDPECRQSAAMVVSS